MAACLHTFRGYRVPAETVERVRQAILDTRGAVDVFALRATVAAEMVAVSPWASSPRELAAANAVNAFLFDASRAGLIRRGGGYGWAYRPWVRVRGNTGRAC
ncbi:hypothetical protein [Achromobacter xylosoxidans]|uniref:hypothetical protein n=1 Tax=Alcaligenes xylosoxydans xylosoxydans TaxID=85698 RepID=UPI001EEE4460|nr:hypothetical protein [Achromobacter xylosoxidans]